jgi:hypothetical protein
MLRNSWRPWFQFRLNTLFWLSLVVSITATLSYRAGIRAGIDEQLATQHQGELYAKLYPVPDLVLGPGMTNPDFATLIDLLKSINPQKWDDVGGDGSIEGFSTNNSIVVYQDANTHRRIEYKLAELRQLQQPTWINRITRWINDPYTRE